MGSRHRERSRDKSNDRSRGRDKDRDRRRRSRSRDRRSRSRDRRSKSKERRRDRDRRGRGRHSHSRDRSRDRRSKSRERRSRDRNRDYNKEKSAEKDVEKQVALLNSLTSIATSRNFSSLVNVKEELHNGSSNGSATDCFENETEREREERRKKRKSRWSGGVHDKTFIPGMPTILPNTLNKEQEEAYLIQLQIEEVSRKLRSGDLGIAANPEERSPSPEPIYSSDGKRLNTREFRTRRRLEEERHALVLKMQSINPEFKPPVDYKPPIIRVNDKVMIPQEEHPEINFVGLLIGPRGNTLKTMEKETGAKIIIRGKGSVKEGKVGRKDGQPLPGEDEPLHAYITATNPEAVKKAVERIKEVIRQGVEVPENQNDLRRMQLRELAQLNGTLRENDGPRCTNCGATDHKSWLCPDKPNVTLNIVCSSCGGAGHIPRDCRHKRPGMGGPPQQGDRAKIDEEYMSLMAELGEGPPPDITNNGNGPLKRNIGYPGVFDRPMAPRAIMPGPMRPDQPMNMQTPPQMIPNSLPPPPWGQSGPGMGSAGMGAPPMGGPNMPPNMAMGWGQQGPPCPPGMMPPPPPPGAGSPPNIPPLLPWLAGNNQPPPPGAGNGPQNMMPPPPPQGNNTVPPPVQWNQGPPPPPPPGIDINTLAGLPNLLAAPPPPPPAT